MAKQLVVEWTRQTLRLALAQGSGRQCRVRTITSETLGPAGANPELLKRALERIRPGGAKVVGVIPREHVISRLVRFPSTQPAELAQMVELYAKAQLPYPGELTVADFHVLKQEEGFTTVAIIACQREAVERLVELLRAGGLEPTVMTVSSWGVFHWYQRFVQRGQVSVQEPALVVHLDDARTDLVLIGGGRILASRSVGQGVTDWEASGKVVELLALEVERSRAAVRKELATVEFRSVVLSGLGALLEWQEPLSHRLNLPVVTADSWQPFKELQAGRPTQVSPVVVGGLACSDAQGLLNLSPGEVREQVRHRRQARELSAAGALLFAVFVLGAGLLGLRVQHQSRVAAQVEALVASVSPQTKQLQVKARANQLVAGVLEQRRTLAKTLSGVFRATPAVISLERLAFERARQQITLRGTARTTQQVLDYVKQLERIGTVKQVRLRYTTRRKLPGGERTDFELIITQGERAS